MSLPVQEKIKKSLQAAEGLYYRLVLIVGETGSGKTQLLRDLAKDLNTEPINVNLKLSAELLELTTKQRALRLPEILDRVTDNGRPVVILDNLEILFDKDLKQDPLRLLQALSRKRSVVASWNGTTSKRALIYAVATHPEYRRYESVDALIVSMDGTASIDDHTI